MTLTDVKHVEEEFALHLVLQIATPIEFQEVDGMILKFMWFFSPIQQMHAENALSLSLWWREALRMKVLFNFGCASKKSVHSSMALCNNILLILCSIDTLFN